MAPDLLSKFVYFTLYKFSSLSNLNNINEKPSQLYDSSDNNRGRLKRKGRVIRNLPGSRALKFKLREDQRKIVENILSDRKTGAQMARLYNVREATISRVTAQDGQSLR